MNKELYDYLKYQWIINNQSKYHKYFDEWINNLTDIQIEYYKLLWLK